MFPKLKYFWFEYPLWSILARFGRRLRVHIDVLYDEEVDVYVATSKDMRGLVCEAETMELLREEVNRVVRDLVFLCSRGKKIAEPVLIWPEL